MLKQLKITFVLFCCFLYSFSQLQVRNYFSFSGKKDIAVNVIAQDLDGYLLLGTNDGVYRFDGKVSKKIVSIKSEITSLFVDGTNLIWIGTRSGKVYNFSGKKLDSLAFSKSPNQEKITDFYESKSGIWIGTYGNGLYLYHEKKLEHYTSENGLSDNVIYNFTGDGAQKIWCGTDAGITQFDFSNKNKPLFSIISNEKGLPDNIVRHVSFFEGRLLVAMQDSGVIEFNIRNQLFARINKLTNHLFGPALSASMEHAGKITVANEKNCLMQLVNGVLYTYPYQEYIQNSSINHMFVDRAKQIWVASKKGITQFVETRFNVINKAVGLSDEKILAVAVDDNQHVWVGTTKGVSILENAGGGSLKEINVGGLDKYTISCDTKAPDGAIWFGTYGNGIIVMSSENKISIVLNSKDGKLTNDNISNIFFTDKNVVYISTLGGGLLKARFERNGIYESFNVEKKYMEKDGLGNDYIYSAVETQDGKLYVATDGGGLNVLEHGKFTNLAKKFSLNSNTFFSLCLDKFNNLWAISNEDGIIKYDGKSIKSFNLSSGLRDLQPQQIIAVDNTIFSINNKGIDKINSKDNTISYYDLFDKGIDPNLNAVCFYNGKIYSGTDNGLIVYRTGIEHLDSIKPSILISSLFVNYQPFPLDSLFEFKYKQNDISIGFNGIWLKNPDKLFYRYRLNGLEDEWKYSDEGKIISYNNLDPGNYTFMVQTRNEEGIWSDPTGYSFIILTPFWKRWWFWVLVIGAGSLGLYSFFKYRIKALQKENLILEQRVVQRTKEIEKQASIIEEKNKELEQLSLVASKTDNVVIILDPFGKVEYINESFIRLNKMTLAEIKKKYGETIFDLSNNPNIRELVNDAVTNKRSVYYESINNKIESEFAVWESSTLTPIFDEEGQLKKIIIIDTDVSEAKRQEQIIVQKNKDITDSIAYARKIQTAILPATHLIQHYLPKSFILYMTKDIVSGDFYWFTHFEGFSIIAAVDCTGHGVPGAFMSLIGYNLLNRIINENKITDPKEILLELNKGVIGVLHKNESESKDGMDIAICKINHSQKTLEYSGAMRPIWIVNNGELTEIKADKIPIGTKQKDRDDTIAFTTHTFELGKGDSFYIFTDGFADQFGGEKDKKYSTGRFKNLILANSNLDCETQEKNIREDHLAWKKNNEQVDDILLIGFTI